jgi:hypothetical protein
MIGSISHLGVSCTKHRLPFSFLIHHNVSNSETKRKISIETAHCPSPIVKNNDTSENAIILDPSFALYFQF